MTSLRIRIDENTWGEASNARRKEFQIAIDEMRSDPLLTFAPLAVHLDVMRTAQGFALSLSDEQESALATANIPRTVLSGHITEYVDIVRQMEKADDLGRHRIEALDMAKKLAHDEAADTLLKELPSFGFDHATCRRLWTLLLSLRVDTTKLTGVRGHRPIR